MMRALWILAVACVVAMPVAAQDDRLDELGFEEAAISDEAVPYFAVGVGPAFTFSFLPMDDINARAKELGVPELSSPMILFGAEVFSAVGFVPNLRAGFSWMSGSDKQSAPVPGQTPQLDRTMEYNLSMSTLHLDYAITLAKGLAVAPGLGFGWGTQTIKAYQSQANRNWSDYDSISTAPDMQSTLEHGVLYVPARLNLEYAVTPFIAIRGQAAYTIQVSSGDWKGNNTAVVANVPDGINVSAFSAQVGLFVGLFN